MADAIRGDVGDDSKNTAIGKDIDQRTGNVQNTYIDTNNPKSTRRRDSITLDERLDRLETFRNEADKTMTRLVALIDGNPSWRVVGLPDQLASYIASDHEWKKATEQRIGKLEENNSKQITITPQMVALVVVVGAACLVLAFLALSWLQTKKPLVELPGIMAYIVAKVRMFIHGSNNNRIWLDTVLLSSLCSNVVKGDSIFSGIQKNRTKI